MYYKQFSPIGCLLWFLFFTWVFFKLKLYYLVFALLFLAICYSVYKRIITYKEHKLRMSEMNYEPKTGEVSKICPNCNNDVRRSAKVCQYCGYKFD